MPYKSKAQQRFFHANEGKLKGLSSKVVKEWDDATSFKGLPDRKGKTPAPNMSMHQSAHKFVANYEAKKPTICKICGQQKSSHKS